AGGDPEHRRRISAVDRKRQVAVRVLVEDQVAGPGIGEGPGGHGVVALVADLKLEPRTWDDPDLFGMGAVEIQLDVPEAVNRQDGASDPRRADLRLREVETRERVRCARRPELRQPDRQPDVRSGRGTDVAAVEGP